jgi:hypothetical protein
LGAAAFIVLKKDTTGATVGSSIVLEPITTLGANAFTDSFDEENLSGPLSIALADFPDLGKDVVSALAGRVTNGDTPGLYGGSQNVAVCNVQGLIDFLANPANKAKATAWAGTLGVKVADIPTYLKGLTPVRLRFDTRVTNHGFKNGEATPHQSLLQAGTAVLIDDTGVPRVKCNCGNPLLEPEPLGEVRGNEQDKTMSVDFVASNPKDAWEGLDPDKAVTVKPGKQVTSFTLVDLETGRLFQRKVGDDVTQDEFVVVGDESVCKGLEESPTCKVGKLGTGDVQVTLQWSSQADLDLHIFEPDGTEIFYDAPGPSASGGQLDVDSNAKCDPGASVENVFWPSGAAPEGDFTAIVYGFGINPAEGKPCGNGDYVLTITVAGETQTFEGTVGQDEQDKYPFKA